MTRPGSPTASLLLHLPCNAVARSIFSDTLDWVDAHPSIPVALRFPLSWLCPKRTPSDFPFTTVSESVTTRLLQLVADGRITVAAAGFAGACEAELAPSVLEHERSWVTKNPFGTGLSEQTTDRTAIAMPYLVDTGRLPEPDASCRRLIGWNPFRGGGMRAVFLGPEGIAVEIAVFDATTAVRGSKQPAAQTVRGLRSLRNHFSRDEHETVPVCLVEVALPEDLSLLSRIVDGDDHPPNARNADTVIWTTLAAAMESGTAASPPPYAMSERHVLAGNRPCVFSAVVDEWKQAARRTGTGYSTRVLDSLVKACAIEDIPHRVADPPPEREIIASMFGRVHMSGDFLELAFSGGRIERISGASASAEGSDIRIPAMEIENRRIVPGIESAFSFETETGRGLRQISVLSSDAITLPGRAVTDYVFLDSYPGLIVDVRIQYPWIDRDIEIEQYLPLIVHSWFFPEGEEPSLARIMPDGSRIEHDPIGEAPGIAPGDAAGLIRKVLGRKPRLETLLLPASCWEIGTRRGAFRIRRADSIVYPHAVIPGVFVVCRVKGGTAVGICPTRGYHRVPSQSLRGVQEHFALVVYEPAYEDEIRTGADKKLKRAVFTPWMYRG